MDSNQGNNLRQFIRRIRARIKPFDPSVKFPLDEGWDALKTRILSESEGQEPVENGRKRPAGDSGRVISLLGKVRYAAAIILVLSVSALYWLTRSHWASTMNPVAGAPENVHTVVAGLAPSKGVVLTLADGRKIALDQPQNLQEAGGVAIHADSGSVKYQAPASTTANTVLHNTLEVPRGNRSRLTLPDGTQVLINSASKLTYPTQFAGPQRIVSLTGEAFFEVSKDVDHPFVVQTNGMNVVVLGTSFDINGYDAVLLTTLVDGKVSVEGQEKKIVLQPGQQAVVDIMAGTLKKISVNTADFTAWKDDELYIGNASLDKIAQILGRIYDYEIVLGDPALEKLHFTVDMAMPKNLQDVLERIRSTTSGIRFDIAGRKVTILPEEKK